MNIPFKTKQIISMIVDCFGLSDYTLKRINPKIILGYHRILPEKEAADNMAQDCMWVSPSNFEKQIQWMLRFGKIMSLEELVEDKEENKPAFAITFDDGWIDNYKYAFPILKKYNLPAKIFLSTNAIEKNQMFWPEEIFYKTIRAIRNGKLKYIIKYLISLDEMPKFKGNDITEQLNHFVEHLKLLNTSNRNKMIVDYYSKIQTEYRPIYGQILSWENIREMLQHNITFGSHTHNHMITEGANQTEIFNELIVSKKIIEQHIETKCKWFCYPNARFNNDDHVLLKQAGYDYGVTLHCARLKTDDSPYYLPRFIMYEDITKVLGYIKLRFIRIPYF